MLPRIHLLIWFLVAAILLAVAARSFILRPEPVPTAAAPAGGRHFEDRARESGLTFRMNFLPGEQGEKFKANLYDHGCGLAVGDFDGDGRDDIYFVNQLGRNALYRNRGDGTFEDVTGRAGVALGDRICVGATFADYDNDGRQDLFVTSTRGGNVLFRNMGDGTFKDVTKSAGVAHVGHSQTAVFFDYDNDGYLDLLVTNCAQWTEPALDSSGRYFPGMPTIMDMAKCPKETNILYHNNGDGTFTDVTAKAGLGGLGWSGDVAVFDYDDDGYLDLLVTNMFGRSQLYHNNGNGTFTDVTLAALGPTSWGGVGAKVFDFDNDGRLDLLIVDMHSDMWVPAGDDPAMIKKLRESQGTKFPGVTGMSGPTEPGLEAKFADAFHIRYSEVLFGNTFFKNLGGGKFREMSDQAGLETFWPWGIATGDFDNDGFEDVFLPSGMGYPYGYWPNALMMNNGDGTFADRAEAVGIEPPVHGLYLEETIGGERAARSSRCAAVADFDGDGRLQIVTNNFNDIPYLFKNRFPRKNYLAFRLRGTRSNRDAIGAVVRLHTGREVMVRQVNPAGGYLSQSSKTVHFGLGDRQRVDRVEITWPRGARQVIDAPEINRLHDIVEP
jgi:hypothetical protein